MSVIVNILGFALGFCGARYGITGDQGWLAAALVIGFLYVDGRRALYES